MENENLVTVKVLFFAQSKELAGIKESTIRLPEKISYSQLLQQIADRFNLAQIKDNVLLAKNEEVCDKNSTIEIRESDNIAIIDNSHLYVIRQPHRMDHLRLTMDKLSVEEVSELVIDQSCGAVSLFVGTTRDYFDHKKVVHLEYEAYEAMALKSMKILCNDMRQKWPDVHGIAIHHRLGRVCVREASVVIAVSSPHRQDSLDAVSYCIDHLKATVPIWKKEMYDDDQGAGVWKQNSECPRKRIPETTETIEIDPSLIQINVSCDELQSRIQSFIERKRQQVNLSNIHDFIPSKMQHASADVDTCARTSAVFVKRSDSKGHLKVHRVNNEWGPQTVRQPLQLEKPPSGSVLPSGVEERVLDIERFLNIRSVTPDVYKRLKEMEDRIRHLESISPEYAAFWKSNTSKTAADTESTAKNMDCRYTADEIDRKIEALEKQNVISWST